MLQGSSGKGCLNKDYGGDWRGRFRGEKRGENEAKMKLKLRPKVTSSDDRKCEKRELWRGVERSRKRVISRTTKISASARRRGMASNLTPPTAAGKRPLTSYLYD